MIRETFEPSHSSSTTDVVQRFDAGQSPAPAVHPGRRLRVAFYSHDTMGMGHLRRNMLIASSLSAGRCEADTLLIAGTREAGFFAEQAGLDCVTLPAVAKDRQGNYTARHYGWSLEETTRLRGRVIASTLLAFKPDLLVVDKLPQGICDELQRTLRIVRSRLRTHCVLGLRDILDAPHVAMREWTVANNDAIIEKYFDEVWVYGDPSIYDCRSEYCFASSTVDRIFFTGYLDQQARIRSPQPSATVEPPLALCVLGGGQDGLELARTFVAAGVPIGWQGALITGPFMPTADRQRLAQLAATRSAGDSGPIQIIDQLVEADDYVQRAARVIAMGGYNTVMSVLSFRKPALIVPRTQPRAEQWIRAEKLARAGLISVLHPDELQPACIRKWLDQPTVPVPGAQAVDLSGLNRIQRRVIELAEATRCQV